MEILLGFVIGEGVVIIGLAIALIVALRKGRAPKGKADNVYVKDGERYTRDRAEFTADGDVAVTHREGDVLLERGVTYTVGKGGLLPGKYTVLSSGDNCDRFNLRVGGIDGEYAHASDIVLADGEKIAAVSHSVILR